MENEVSGLCVPSARQDVIRCPGDHWVGELRSDAGASVVTAPSLAQGPAATGINGQHRIEITAERVHHHRATIARGRRRKLIPHAAAEAALATRNHIASAGSGDGGLGVGVAGTSNDNRAATLII